MNRCGDGRPRKPALSEVDGSKPSEARQRFRLTRFAEGKPIKVEFEYPDDSSSAGVSPATSSNGTPTFACCVNAIKEIRS
jgi:hypothetical protein